MPYSSLGKRLRDLRLRRGLTLQAVATAAGITPQAVSQIERGLSHSPINTLEKLASALDARLDITVIAIDETDDLLWSRVRAVLPSVPLPMKLAFLAALSVFEEQLERENRSTDG